MCFSLFLTVSHCFFSLFHSLFIMSRQIALERELEQLTQINKVIGDVITTISKTGDNIGTANESIENTNQLLNQWIRILSQANYTKDIINNGSWQGENDNDDIESKLQHEQQLIEQVNELMKEQRQLQTKITNKQNDRRRIKKR